MAAITVAPSSAGSRCSGPPLTTRWPTTLISFAEEMTRVEPVHSVASSCCVASSRDATFTCCLDLAPDTVEILICASAPDHSISPCQAGSAGPAAGSDCAGGAFALKSYSELFRLLDPELSTRIFIRPRLVPGHRVGPFPVFDFRHVVAVRVDILFVLEQLIAQMLLKMRADFLQPRNAVDRVAGQMIAVQVIQHGHIERGGDGAFFFVAVDVQAAVIGAF